MHNDNSDKVKKPTYHIGQDISAVSVEELSATIADLKAEIIRVEHEMNAKRAQRGAADALFKT